MENEEYPLDEKSLVRLGADVFRVIFWTLFITAILILAIIFRGELFLLVQDDPAAATIVFLAIVGVGCWGDRKNEKTR